MVEIVWTKKALNQLESATKYIREEQGHYYAKIVLNKIFQTTELLGNSPKIGATEPLLTHKILNIDIWLFGVSKSFIA
jgi:plasmid stabilization system protein ParE